MRLGVWPGHTGTGFITGDTKPRPSILVGISPGVSVEGEGGVRHSLSIL